MYDRTIYDLLLACFSPLAIADATTHPAAFTLVETTPHAGTLVRG